MKCKHFIIQQLVPPEIYTSRGEGAWELLDSNLLIVLDQLYETFGRITINNWHSGGQYKESGLRLWASTTGAAFSQHKYGRAADCKPLDITVKQLYEGIIANQAQFPLLTTLENNAATPTWVHVDVRNNQTAGIRIVNP